MPQMNDDMNASMFTRTDHTVQLGQKAFNMSQPTLGMHISPSVILDNEDHSDISHTGSSSPSSSSQINQRRVEFVTKTYMPKAIWTLWDYSNPFANPGLLEADPLTADYNDMLLAWQYGQLKPGFVPGPRDEKQMNPSKDVDMPRGGMEAARPQDVPLPATIGSLTSASSSSSCAPLRSCAAVTLVLTTVTPSPVTLTVVAPGTNPVPLKVTSIVLPGVAELALALVIAGVGGLMVTV